MARAVPADGAVAGDVRVARQRVADQDGVALVGIEPAVRLVHDGHALQPAALALYDRFGAAWTKANGSTQPSEEGLAGFAASWALFHDVLPNVAQLDDPASIAAAARAVDLPEGSLPNGSGLRFSNAQGRLGQNELAAAVVWQWQRPTTEAAASPQSVTVWPAQFASGPIDSSLVPLPR